MCGLILSIHHDTGCISSAAATLYGYISISFGLSGKNFTTVNTSSLCLVFEDVFIYLFCRVKVNLLLLTIKWSHCSYSILSSNNHVDNDIPSKENN